MGKRKGSGYGLVLISAVLWGMLPIFTRKLYGNGWSPQVVSAMRAYLGAVITLVTLILNGTLSRFRVKDIPFYLLYGTLGISGCFLAYGISIQMNSTAVAAVLLYTGPAFVNIFERIFYKKRLTWVKILSLIITFAGCAMVVGLYDLSTVTDNLLGIVVGLLSGICYSMTTVIGEKAKEKYPGSVNGRLILLFGAFAFLFVAPPWNMPVFGGGDWLLFVCLAVFGSVLPYTCYLAGIDFGVEGGVASIVATLEPVMAIVFGVTLLGDSLEWPQILGIAVVIAGVVLPILHSDCRKKETIV